MSKTAGAYRAFVNRNGRLNSAELRDPRSIDTRRVIAEFRRQTGGNISEEAAAAAIRQTTEQRAISRRLQAARRRNRQ